MRNAWADKAVGVAGSLWITAGVLLAFTSGASSDSLVFAFAGVALVANGLMALLAASDPVRHWPVVAGQLALTLALPVLAARAALTGVLPWSLAGLAGVISLVVSWLLTLTLLRAHDQYRSVESVVRISTLGLLREGLAGHRTGTGLALNGLVEQTPVLLVFLRHTGCTFCRQTLADLSAAAPALTQRGVQLVLVHHSSEEAMTALVARYQLDGVQVVHDEHRRLYRHFGLKSGSAWQVALNPWVLLRSAWSVFVERHGMNRPDGDPRQMPAAFTLFRGRVLSGYFHGNASDRPDYVQLCSAIDSSQQ